MALILSVKVGDDIFVGSQRLVVKAIRGDGDIDIGIKGEVRQIGDRHMVQVLPGVYLAAGLLANNPRYVRLAIKAPREVLILKGDRYREAHRASA